MKSQTSGLLPCLGVLLASLSETGAAIDGQPTDTVGFVGLATQGPMETPTLVTSQAEFERLFGGYDAALPNPFLAPSVAAFFSNDGRRAYVVRVADASDAAFVGGVDATGQRTGLQALGEIDPVSIVCIPGVTSRAVQEAMIAHCEAAGDRIAVLDPDEPADVPAVLAQRERLRSERGYAALYYPWIVARLPGIDAVLLPPSGFVAGVYARTDLERGVWKAPAGDVAGALDASRALSATDQDALNLAGVSVIRSFPGLPVQLWGVRTIASDPEWKYVNVRRFLIFLEESINKGTEWAVFEPNDEGLWSRLRGDIENFLVFRWREGGLLGATSDDAFFVRVDRSSMTQDDIDRGRTVILVGVAVLQPAEFVIFRVVKERATPVRFRRGDSNGDGVVDISDAIGLLGFLFLGDDAPPCPDAADAVDEGEPSISAAIFILSFLFQGGRPMPQPFPDCGEDPSGDALGECEDPAGVCR